MILGVHENADPKVTTARFPGATWASGFVSDGGKPLPESTTAGELVAAVMAKAKKALDAGGGCVVRVKLDMLAAGRGVWDARLTVLGRAVEGLNIILVLHHEPEDDWAGAVFAAGFNRGRRAVRAGGPNVQVAYCAMAYHWARGMRATRDPRPRQSVEADWFLIDLYSGKSFEPTATIPEHPGFQRWYAEMVAPFPGRRWGVAERGILAGPTRAATIAREAEWLATDPVGRTCGMYLWWSTGGAENNAGWVLDQAGAAAVAALIARIGDAPAVPAYEPGPIARTLVHTATGAVVAEGRTKQWDAFVTTVA